MREILFRGKRADKYGWVEGYLLFDEAESRYRIITKLEYSTGTYIDTGYAPRVVRDTVGQFTGKYDGNREKIFEHDIVQFDDGYCAEVLWDEEDAMFIIDGGDVSDIYERLGDIDPESIAVISNIFDNPELMKGGGRHDD